jgi:hypothetical protein
MSNTYSHTLKNDELSSHFYTKQAIAKSQKARILKGIIAGINYEINDLNNTNDVFITKHIIKPPTLPNDKPKRGRHYNRLLNGSANSLTDGSTNSSVVGSDYVSDSKTETILSTPVLTDSLDIMVSDFESKTDSENTSSESFRSSETVRSSNSLRSTISEFDEIIKKVSTLNDEMISMVEKPKPKPMSKLIPSKPLDVPAKFDRSENVLLRNRKTIG